MKYLVKTGIFEGTIFEGTIIKDRIYNNATTGQSFPLENCKLLNRDENFKINDEVKIIKPFPNKDLTGKIAKVVEVSQFRKPIFYIEVEGQKIVCLPEYVKKL